MLPVRNGGGERQRQSKMGGTPRLLYCTDWQVRMYWVRGCWVKFDKFTKLRKLVRFSISARLRPYPAGKALTLPKSHCRNSGRLTAAAGRLKEVAMQHQQKVQVFGVIAPLPDYKSQVQLPGAYSCHMLTCSRGWALNGYYQIGCS